jgi:hypothetical protein
MEYLNASTTSTPRVVESQQTLSGSEIQGHIRGNRRVAGYAPFYLNDGRSKTEFDDDNEARNASYDT